MSELPGKFRQSPFHAKAAIQPQRLSGLVKMPSKPNFKFQRAERDRAKKALKDSKLQERKEQAALRKASETADAHPADSPGEGTKE